MTMAAKAATKPIASGLGPDGGGVEKIEEEKEGTIHMGLGERINGY